MASRELDSPTWVIPVLAEIAMKAPHALRLAAQLFGVAPCPRCDYIKAHCRCPKEKP